MALTLWFIGPTCDVKHQPRLETIRTHEKVSKSFLKEPPSDVILALLPVKHGYLKRFFLGYLHCLKILTPPDSSDSSVRLWRWMP